MILHHSFGACFSKAPEASVGLSVSKIREVYMPRISYMRGKSGHI